MKKRVLERGLLSALVLAVCSAGALAFSPACRKSAEEHMITCSKSRQQQDPCIYISIDEAGDDCAADREDPELKKLLGEDYAKLKQGIAIIPGGAPSNPANPAAPAHPSGGQNPSPTIVPGSNSSSSKPSSSTNSSSASQSQNAEQKDDAQAATEAAAQAVKQKLDNSSAVANSGYLEKKHLSRAAVEKGLGINGETEKAAVLLSAVVVGGRYSSGQLPTHSGQQGAQQDAAKSPQKTQQAQPGISSEEYRQSMAYSSQASIKMSLKDYAGAAGEATSAISKNPANYGAYLLRAAASNYLNRYDDAITDSSYVVKNEPANATAYNIRAWAYSQKGNTEAAKSDADHAIQLDPSMASAYYNRALIAEKMGNYRKTLEDLRDAASMDSDYDSKFKEALAKYKAQVPGFEYRGEAFPSDEAKAAAQADSQVPQTNWGKIYALLGGLAVGVLILIQLVKSMRKAPPAAPQPRALMNQFIMVRKVGEGGMGVVYEGYDKTLKRKVAIKKMRTDIGMSDEAKEQLLGEARTVAALRHPNIVDIYTVFEEAGDLFLVFEYVEGVTLDARLEKDGRIPFGEARAIFKFICRALEYAHANNIIHRDLKPGNIMISTSGVVKVMDFGVARQLDGTRSSNTISGTPAYMSPEQQKGFIKKESDIYSLGICLYETLTGHVPWELEGFDPSRSRIIPPSSVVPSLPPEVDRLLEGAINPDIEARIPSAEKFWELLEKVPD